MRIIKVFPILIAFVIMAGCTKEDEPRTGEVSGFVIDHTSVKLSAIPSMYIEAAKENLHIAYSHTSHGSQLT
ncbi:MAG: hypothetical protein GYA41_03655, partial [Bacteroidales bacterium]|nr:hypothetical protein [Bacteroidales bacterium]